MLDSTCLTRKSVDNLLSLTHLQGNGLEWNLNRREKLRKKRSMLSGTRTELQDTRIVDFDGHNIAWLDEQGNIIDYEGRHRGFYENGVMREPEGKVVGLGQDPAGPHPVLPNKGLIPGATKAASAPKKPKPKSIMKKPEASLLWSKKMLVEL